MLVLSFVNLNQLLEEKEVAQAGTALKPPSQTSSPQISEEENRDNSLYVNVWNTSENEMQEVSLHDYLIGVVSGEMPATFEMEALKAQAVAARTYTLSHLQPYGTTRCATNPEANVCTNAQCCHAYSTIEQMQTKWGEEFEEKYEKIRIGGALFADTLNVGGKDRLYIFSGVVFPPAAGAFVRLRFPRTDGVFACLSNRADNPSVCPTDSQLPLHKGVIIKKCLPLW